MTDLMAKSLPGFEHIQRYWDASKNMYVAKIQPGELYVTQHHEVISTVLGSCVSACIWDPALGLGGMNHFMLPLNANALDSGIFEANCYGSWAMESLINQILKAGGRRWALEIKVFGGSRVIGSLSSEHAIGDKNIHFVLNYIQEEQLTLVSKDLGGAVARSIIFYPKTGKVLVKHLTDISKTSVLDKEQKYQHQIIDKNVGNDVDLF